MNAKTFHSFPFLSLSSCIGLLSLSSECIYCRYSSTTKEWVRVEGRMELTCCIHNHTYDFIYKFLLFISSAKKKINILRSNATFICLTPRRVYTSSVNVFYIIFMHIRIYKVINVNVPLSTIELKKKEGRRNILSEAQISSGTLLMHRHRRSTMKIKLWHSYRRPTIDIERRRRGSRVKLAHESSECLRVNFSTLFIQNNSAKG